MDSPPGSPTDGIPNGQNPQRESQDHEGDHMRDVGGRGSYRGPMVRDLFLDDSPSFIKKNVFVEPRPVHLEEQVMCSSPNVSSSTPRRHSLQTENLFNVNASPLVNAAFIRPRASSVFSPFPEPLAFTLNNLTQSPCNDSGINECSFALNSVTTECVRSLNTNLNLNETPSGIYFNEDEVMEPLSESDEEEGEEEEKMESNKRGLSDSYLALKEKSPSVPQSKRLSSQVLPRVPNCMDASYNDPPLIGDNSREYLLPYDAHCISEHRGFKCISPHTLADLVRGRFEKEVDEYLVIDTRYPYEYNGGHIAGAANVVTKEDMAQKYLTNPAIGSTRQVVIFHCEFSSKRGPRMCRFVRKEDRALNTYPKLFYPELYILHGGYREFFPLYPGLCTPQNYVLMLDPAFEQQLVYWQKAAKLSGGNGQTVKGAVRGLIARTRSSRQLDLP